MPTEYKKGDVIEAKMGGPMMIVEKVRGDSTLECAWFDGNNELHRDVFDPEAIEGCEAEA